MKYKIGHSIADTYMIFFHGNAEDMYVLRFIMICRGRAYPFLLELQMSVRCNIVALEYPGYGMYQGHKPNAEQIEEDSHSLYLHLRDKMKIEDSKIIIFGRSIGSGPACYLASLFQPKLLILMSPFLSIRAVAKHYASVAAYLLKEQFDNETRAEKIKCPALVIHGKSDKLIPVSHAQLLYSRLGGAHLRL